MLADRERCRDEHPRAPRERELHRSASELGTGGSETRDGGAGELCERWVTLGELVADAESVLVDLDDVATL